MPKRKRNSINTPFARTIIFSGVILLLVAFLLMRLETVSTWIGTILSTLRPVIIGAVITLVLHTPVRRLEVHGDRHPALLDGAKYHILDGTYAGRGIAIFNRDDSKRK